MFLSERPGADLPGLVLQKTAASLFRPASPPQRRVFSEEFTRFKSGQTVFSDNRILRPRIVCVAVSKK